MNPIIKTKCRNLLKEYEELLIELAEKEKATLQKTDYSSAGDTPFEIAKQAIFNQGIIEGQKRTIQELNRLAK